MTKLDPPVEQKVSSDKDQPSKNAVEIVCIVTQRGDDDLNIRDSFMMSLRVTERAGRRCDVLQLSLQRYFHDQTIIAKHSQTKLSGRLPPEKSSILGL